MSSEGQMDAHLALAEQDLQPVELGRAPSNRSIQIRQLKNPKSDRSIQEKDTKKLDDEEGLPAETIATDNDELSVSKSTQQEPWTPYEHHYMAELPLDAQQKIEPITAKWIATRWSLLRPFNTRIPVPLPFSTLGFTVGEVLVALGAMGVVAGVGAAQWSDPSSLGSSTAIVLMLATFFVPRMSIMPILLGLSFERGLFWHKFLVLLTVAMSITHACSYFYENDWEFAASYSGEDSDKVITGTVLVSLMILMILFAFYPLRRRFYTVFIFVHVTMFIAVVIAGLLHGASAIIAGLVILVLDNVFRYALRVPRAYKLTSGATLTQMPGTNITRIEFAGKPINYHGGQFAFICVPAISRFEWHPLSLSSSPDSPVTQLHCRASGDWSQKLFDLAGEANGKRTVVYIDGPYGEPMVDIEGSRYKSILLVAGGIGITPMISTFTSLLNQYARGRPLQQVRLVWVARDMRTIDALLTPSALQKAATESGDELKSGSLATAAAISFEPATTDTALHVDTVKEDKVVVAVPRKDTPDVFRMDIHLTDKTAPTNKPENSIPFVNTTVANGQPNIASIFDEVAGAAAANGDGRVAVMVCGPAGLAANVRNRCNAHAWAKNGGGFDFHAEVFEF